jgi:hypothetical protein
MTTDSSANAAARSWLQHLLRLAIWRFSIRELLLLTATVAALVALFLAYYQASQPFSPSVLNQEFGSGSHIRAAAAPLHPQIVLIHGVGAGGGDQHALTQEYGYSISLPREVRGKFMARLHSDAQKMLNKDRPSFSGSSSGGNDLAGFHYTYHGGPSRGVIVVRRTDLSDDEMHLSILIYEHEDAR